MGLYLAICDNDRRHEERGGDELFGYSSICSQISWPSYWYIYISIYTHSVVLLGVWDLDRILLCSLIIIIMIYGGLPECIIVSKDSAGGNSERSVTYQTRSRGEELWDEICMHAFVRQKMARSKNPRAMGIVFSEVVF